MNNNFFVQMKKYKIEKVKKRQVFVDVVLGILYCIFCFCWLYIGYGENLKEIFAWILLVDAISMCICFIVKLFLIIKLNSLSYIEGKISGGIKNFAIIGGLIYVALIFCYFTANDDRSVDFIKSIFTPITTIMTAILALLGIHYQIMKKEKEQRNSNNLIFKIKKEAENIIELNSTNKKENISIFIENISENIGYLIAVYGLKKDEIYVIANNVAYSPIMPNQAYNISNIKINRKTEEIFLVYKDISDNYYYLLFNITDKKNITILNVDFCDYEFILEKLNDTNNKK